MKLEQEFPQRHALICLHHQPVPVGSVWLDANMLNNADALFTITDQHPQLRSILWGHVHQRFDATRNNVRLLACPSSCIQFKPGCADFTRDDKPPGYRWLELQADSGIDTGIAYLSVT